MAQQDPFKTRPLPDLARLLARPVTLTAPALIATALAPTLLLAAILLAWGAAHRPAPLPIVLLATPTLGVPIAATAPATGMPRAVVAYDAPGGAVVGAIEPGRAYVVVARSGLEWAQLDVARPLEPANLVWVRAAEVPEISAAAGVNDLATPVPAPAPQVIYVSVPPVGPPAQSDAAVPAQAPVVAPAELVALPEPTPAYLVPPVTPAPRSVVVREFPTAPPCRLGEVGGALRICNGLTP